MSAAPLQPDPAAVCDACGAQGAYRFDGESLCTDCYAARGSCCSGEFSGRAPHGTGHEKPASEDAGRNPPP